MAEREKHSFKTSFHESLGLSVYNCGFQSCEPRYFWGPALRDHYLIHFIASGKGKFVCREQTYLLSAGDGFLVTPSERVYYEADEADPWEYYWVGFNGVDAARLVSATGLSEQAPTFHSDRPEQMVERIMRIYVSKGTALADEAEMSGALYQFLGCLIRENRAQDSLRQSSGAYIELAIRYIDHNYSRRISIGDVARNAGISRSHLYRLFMQQLHITPNEYLAQYRINNACELLRTRGINVSEAAYSSGFSDPLYFSRVFKRIKGVTPSKYAAALQDGPQESQEP